ncbi:MAG: biotin synthase BioB [Lachnospiraceae bacterium]|jgi:biotin synthase|nr:biotin synthase BioB [Lachnospiraceae bacterium]
MNVEILGNEVLEGKRISVPEAMWLYQQPLEKLCEKADEIRRHFCSSQFDICTIINGKSGKCSENCRFCAQSSHNHTGTAEYPLMGVEEIVEQARENDQKGVLRYSIVTSGKRLTDPEIDQMCEAVKKIRAQTEIAVCVSFGLLNEAQYRRLKAAGVTRAHNNLETSRRNFPNICTTHTFEDKIQAIEAAQAAGLFVCSGGIMGLGETVEDRIDMALTLRELRIKSVPVNMLNPIPGTPFGENERLSVEDMRRIVAVYRFILPDAAIRLAGGRGLMEDKGKGCFQSGANAAISGDMLTTAGITVETDLKLLRELGYEVRRENA